jgi:hypothetical protein
MALDFSIFGPLEPIGTLPLGVMLGPLGPPIRTVSLGMDEHDTLLELAQPSAEFPMIHRAQDYWKHSDYSAADIELLEAELRSLLIRQPGSKVVADLIELCSMARSAQRGISVLSD